YAVSHGAIQLIIGPFGDRFGKYRTVATMCALASILVALCGTVQSLSALAVARFASGAAAGWIIPLSMAYVGDVTPYERRQPILGRYLTGQISGQLFGQAAGGVLGDLFGWRNVFFVLAAMFALATAGLAGLLYAACVSLLVNRFGQAGLAIFGGTLLGLAYLTLAISAHWWLAPIAVTAIGLGFYALHNTLQTNATQMTPQARGTAVAIFSSAIYLGQAAGVATGAVVFDRLGAVPLFVATAAILPALAWWFARELERRS